MYVWHCVFVFSLKKCSMWYKRENCSCILSSLNILSVYIFVSRTRKTKIQTNFSIIHRNSNLSRTRSIYWSSISLNISGFNSFHKVSTNKCTNFFRGVKMMGSFLGRALVWVINKMNQNLSIFSFSLVQIILLVSWESWIFAGWFLVMLVRLITASNLWRRMSQRLSNFSFGAVTGMLCIYIY